MKKNNVQLSPAIRRKKLAVEINKNKFIYLLLAPAVILSLIFLYAPMGGLKMAFQDYNIYQPSMSEWVGLKNFK